MIGRIVFVLCIVALITGIKAKPMHKDVMSAIKNAALVSIQEDENDNDKSDYDYSAEETNNRQRSVSQRNAQQMLREQQEQLKFIKSKDYQDYEFDTTDTDQFNEDDDLLRRYYAPVRRAANNDYDSFTDFMRLAAAQSNREDRFVKRLHYGDQDSFLNDEADENSDENKASDENIYDDYENNDYDD